MRSTRPITSALALAATSALLGLGAAPGDAQTPDPTAPGTTHERGLLLECGGDLRGRPVRVNLYENRTYGNYLEIELGEGDHELAASRQSPTRFVTKGVVHATARLGSHRATISGTAVRTTQVTRVREVTEDAGLRIVSKGTHTRLRDDLVLRYAKRSTPLECGTAFAYRLTVTKTPVDG